MRMALTIPFSGVPLRDLGPLAHAAEEDGYDSLWSAEATELDGITPLVVAAQHTERVRLVTWRSSWILKTVSMSGSGPEALWPSRSSAVIRRSVLTPRR